MGTEDFFQTSKDLLEAARGTPMDPGGILAVAARLDHDADIVRNAIAAALEEDEAHVAALIAMAAGSRQLRIRGADVRQLLANLPDARMIPIIVGIVRDDRLRLVLDVLENSHLPAEHEATLLVVATILLAGEPAPKPVLARIRTLGRQELPLMIGALVGIAAEASGDKHTREVAARWVAMTRAVAAELRSAIAGMLDGPPESVLQPPKGTEVHSPFAPLKVTKVGRNEPCPCGSGKKYKKCCAGRSEESPTPSVAAGNIPTAGELDKSRAPADPNDIRRMSTMRLARVAFATLTTRTLIEALRRLSMYHVWESAGLAMEELTRRNDLPMEAHPDEYREELIFEAITARAVDVVRLNVSKLTTEETRERLALKLAVLEPSRESLSEIEKVAHEGLEKNQFGELIDLAHAILEQFPALGILVARGALDPQRDFDSGYLLDKIEEARDGLGLPPGDSAADVYDALLEKRADEEERSHIKVELATERRRAREEREELRRALRDASRHVTDLQRQLASVQQTPSRPSKSGETPISDEDPAEARERLKSKIEELKQRMADGQRERAELRRKLEQALAERTKSPPPQSKAPDAHDSVEESDADVASAVRQRVRVPIFTDRARAALGTVPKPVAAQAVRLAGDLAAGDDATWGSVKRLQGLADLFAVRVGIHHRLLFRLPADETALECVALVTREDLLTTIKAFK